MLIALIVFLWLTSSAVPEYERALALFRSRDLSAAAQATQKALAADANYVPAIKLAARIEIASGDFDAAHTRLELAASSHPTDKSLHFLLGFCLYLQNDFPGSLAALAAADSSDPEVLLYRALSTEGLGHIDAAISLYREAIASTPSAEPRLALARLLRREGDKAGAARLVDEALAREPGSREALYEKGQSLFLAGDFSAAAGFGERALAAPGEAPSEREVRYLLMRAYMQSGDTARAAQQRAAFEKLPVPLVR